MLKNSKCVIFDSRLAAEVEIILKFTKYRLKFQIKHTYIQNHDKILSKQAAKTCTASKNILIFQLFYTIKHVSKLFD